MWWLGACPAPPWEGSRLWLEEPHKPFQGLEKQWGAAAKALHFSFSTSLSLFLSYSTGLSEMDGDIECRCKGHENHESGQKALLSDPHPTVRWGWEGRAFILIHVN